MLQAAIRKSLTAITTPLMEAIGGLAMAAVMEVAAEAEAIDAQADRDSAQSNGLWVGCGRKESTRFFARLSV
ncbi:MAG: hypothetical protein KatS3mg017_0327 [Fimbriimonadales bacterium]|nr:MAG: hypothetical protein KatS3mg017_0327 [Fimbriimonadales bacterium]